MFNNIRALLKTLLNTFITLYISGCASTSFPYISKGTPNVQIVFDSKEGFLKSTGLVLGINQIVGKCQSTYLGDLEFESGETREFFIPTNKKLILIFIFEENNYLLKGKNFTRYSYFLKIAQNSKYKLNFITENGSTGVSLQKIAPAPIEPISMDTHDPCPNGWTEVEN